MTEYVRQAALPYDWALKSPALMGLCRAQKVQDDVRGNRARGAGHFVLILFLWAIIFWNRSFGISWEVTHDRRKTARSDQALEPAQEGRGPGGRRAAHPDPRMLLREEQREARGLMRARPDISRDGARGRHRVCGGREISPPTIFASDDFCRRRRGGTPLHRSLGIAPR